MRINLPHPLKSFLPLGGLWLVTCAYNGAPPSTEPPVPASDQPVEDKAASSPAAPESSEESAPHTPLTPPPEIAYLLRVREGANAVSMPETTGEETQEPLDLRPGTLVGHLEEDRKAGLQRVFVFSENTSAWFDRDAFSRSDEWAALEGEPVWLAGPHCGIETTGQYPGLALGPQNLVWAWFAEKPCLASLAPPPEDANPTTEEAQKSPTWQYVLVGETVELSCPQQAIAMPAPGKKPVLAVGAAKVVGREGKGVVVSKNGVTGPVSPTCGKDGELRVGDIRDTATAPRSFEHPVLLHFWATWCAPCLGELPAYQEFADDLGGGRALAVSEDFHMETLERFMRKEGYVFATALDSKQKLHKKFGGTGVLPYTVVLKSGGVVSATTGVVNWEDDTEIRGLLGMELPDEPGANESPEPVPETEEPVPEAEEPVPEAEEPTPSQGD